MITVDLVIFLQKGTKIIRTNQETTLNHHMEIKSNTQIHRIKTIEVVQLKNQLQINRVQSSSETTPSHQESIIPKLQKNN